MALLSDLCPDLLYEIYKRLDEPSLQSVLPAASRFYLDIKSMVERRRIRSCHLEELELHCSHLWCLKYVISEHMASLSNPDSEQELRILTRILRRPFVHRAITNGHLDSLRYILEGPYSKVIYTQRSPVYGEHLVTALRNNQIEIYRYLRSKNINFDSDYYDIDWGVDITGQNGHFDLMFELIAEGGRIKTDYVFIVAARQGRLDVVRHMIDTSRVSQRWRVKKLLQLEEHSAFVLAVKNRDSDMMRYLLRVAKNEGMRISMIRSVSSDVLREIFTPEEDETLLLSENS